MFEFPGLRADGKPHWRFVFGLAGFQSKGEAVGVGYWRSAFSFADLLADGRPQQRFELEFGFVGEIKMTENPTMRL